MKTGRRQGVTAFLGEFETSVLNDKRIRLPVGVTRQLKEAGVRTIRASILPHQEALVLFPEATWPSGIKKITQQDPLLGTPQGFRSFISPSVPLSWDSQGRVSISDRLLQYAGLRVEQPVVIIGVDAHFELWNMDAFEEMRKRCQEALGAQARPKEPRNPDSPYLKKDGFNAKPVQQKLF